MSEPTLRDWRTLYAAAMLEGESIQLGLRIEEAEVAIRGALPGLMPLDWVLPNSCPTKTTLRRWSSVQLLTAPAFWSTAASSRAKMDACNVLRARRYASTPTAVTISTESTR